MRACSANSKYSNLEENFLHRWLKCKLEASIKRHLHTMTGEKIESTAVWSSRPKKVGKQNCLDLQLTLILPCMSRENCCAKVVAYVNLVLTPQAANKISNTLPMHVPSLFSGDAVVSAALFVF